jgi:O-antigen/teichoic acid export membrane protein
LIKRLKPKSEFSRNVLTLMTGTTIAQAIPIAISPILTRIYTPEDFGVFALFVAITSIFGTIANGRYELAIMLPKKDEDAINIFALGFIITTFISLLLLILVLIFQDKIVDILKNEDIRGWLYFVPLAVFFAGLYNILNYFNNRKKQYKDLAKATILKSIVLAIVQLSIGFIKQGATGLISGTIISQFFANTKLLTNIIKDKVLISKISKIKIIALAKRYKDFPKFSMLAGLTNTLSSSLTNIFISSFYGIATLGLYSLVQRVLGMPSALIGGAIGQVFFQKATKEKQQTGRAINSFNSTIKKLIIIGVPSFTILYFIVEDLFAFVFGEKWRIAGIYAQIIMPLFLIRFISSTVSSINIIFEKQLIGLYINILLLISSLSIFVISNLFNFDFNLFLYLLTYILFIEYFIFLIYYNQLSKGDFNEKVID